MKMKACLLLVGLLGCGGDDTSGSTTFSLSFAGTEYAPHSGMMLKIQVIDKADNSVIKSDMTGVTSGMVNFTWADLLEDGGTYQVRWYVDVNGNGACDAPPDDHSWIREVPAVTADATVSHVHDTNVVPVCDTF